jgi:hypothetical protein
MKRKVVLVMTAPGRQKGGKTMRHYHGVWYYKGKTYSNLHEALVANWPNK